MQSSRWRRICVLWTICCSLSAQMPRDGFIMVGLDMNYAGWPDTWFFSPSGAFTWHNWPAPASTSTAVTIEDGEVLYFAEPSVVSFVAPGPYTFYRATVGPGLTMHATALGVYPNLQNQLITGLAVAGDSLWFVTREASFLAPSVSLVGRLDKRQANQAVSTIVDLGQLGFPQTFADARSNGRDLLLWGLGSGSVAGTILRIDTGISPPPVHSEPFAFHPTISNGHLLGARAVLPNQYQFTTENAWTGLQAPIPNAYYSRAPRSLAYNPRTLLVRYYSLVGSDVCLISPNVSQWQFVLSSQQNGFSAHLLPIHEEPVLVYGRGCANATGSDPRMAWEGLPERGGAMSLTVLRTEPASLVLFWLGLSRTRWGSNTLPLDAGFLGAPGCNLLASPEVCQVAISDAIGRADLGLTLPNDPVLAGLRLYAQTGSASGANPFGLAASDALELRCR